MDFLDHLVAARRHADSLREILDALDSELDRAEAKARHALDYWNEQVRGPAGPCPPSVLPDSKLGAGLRLVRDFLRPAPGAPPSPLFDQTVEAMGGVDAARRFLDNTASAGGQGPRDRGGAEMWEIMRTAAAAQRTTNEPS